MVNGQRGYNHHVGRTVLYYGPNRGKYGRETFRPLMNSIQQHLGVDTGFTTLPEHDGILETYSFPDGMEVKHYSLLDGNAFVLVTGDRSRTSKRQREELLMTITSRPSKLEKR